MVELMERAKIFAARAHEGQLYGNLPYIVHLSDVYITLFEYGIKSPPVLVAGWLHDTIEDTNITYSKILKEFDKEVAEMVFALTDELGRNRKDRHEKTYPKLQKNSDSIIVKQADRLANIKTGIREENPMLDMYRKEYKEFKNKLQPYGGLPEMWNNLDKYLGEEA